MALAKNDVYARIELEQVTVQNVIHFLLLFSCSRHSLSGLFFAYTHLHNCKTAIPLLLIFMASIQHKSFAVLSCPSEWKMQMRFVRQSEVQ
jgi:hypothetical protein